jgi:hypothetical protein
MGEDAFLRVLRSGGRTLLEGLKFGLPDELQKLVIFSIVLFFVADSGEEEALKAHALKELGCSSRMTERVHEPGHFGRLNPDLLPEEFMTKHHVAHHLLIHRASLIVRYPPA